MHTVVKTSAFSKRSQKAQGFETGLMGSTLTLRADKRQPEASQLLRQSIFLVCGL